MSERPIVFFDGVCNLCDSFVRFLISIDKNDKLHFASLQGETARAKLPPADKEQLNSVVLLYNKQRYKESSAVLEVFKIVGGAWALMGIFKVVPSGLRDMIYRFIAKNRYRWFGKKEICPMPTKQQQARILP